MTAVQFTVHEVEIERLTEAYSQKESCDFILTNRNADTYRGGKGLKAIIN